MFPKRSLALVALMCGLLWAAPASAGPGHHGGPRGESGYRGGDVPSRIASRLKRAQRALERAEDKVDDGDSAGAASSLASVRRNLGAALKSAKRRVVAGNDTGPDAIGAVVDTQHNVIETTAGLFDGADGTLVDSIADALGSALDGRDDAVAAIAALPADSQADYEYVLEKIDEDIGDEIDAVDEALADDTLTDEARTTLEQAKTRLEASRTAVRALAPAESGTAGVADDDDDRECDGPRGSRGPRDGRGEDADV